MKKIIAAFFALSLTAGLAACNAETSKGYLADKGLDLILEVDKLAESEEYTALFGASEEIKRIVSDIGDNDYCEPKALFEVEDLDSMVRENILANTRLPSDIEVMVKGRFANALPSQINAMKGAMTLAATSILNHGSSFIYKGLTDPKTYIYTYQNGYSFMVTFIPGNENIVNTTAVIVVNADLSECSAKEDVVYFFQNALALEGVQVSDLTKKQ